MAGNGFRLARSQGVEGMCGNLRDYPVNPANNTPIFRGDLVTLTGGYVEAAPAAAATKILGIFWGCKFEAPDGSIEFENYWDGGANRTNIQAQVALLPAGATALVKGAEGQVYTQGDIGTRKVFTSNAGDIRTGMSRAVLGPAGSDVAGAPLIVQQKIDLPDNGNDKGDWFEVSLATDSAVIATGA